MHLECSLGVPSGLSGLCQGGPGLRETPRAGVLHSTNPVPVSTEHAWAPLGKGVLSEASFSDCESIQMETNAVTSDCHWLQTNLPGLLSPES